MSKKKEVKAFLKKVIPQARKQGAQPQHISVFLNRYGIAIKSIDVNMESGKAYMCVEFINDGEIEEAKFDLVEIDGRSIEELEEEARQREETENG